MSKEDLNSADGVVVGRQPNEFFKVQVRGGDHVVLAQISGNLRRSRIHILVGDRVRVELSSHDLSRGQLTYKYEREKRAASNG